MKEFKYYRWTVTPKGQAVWEGSNTVIGGWEFVEMPEVSPDTAAVLRRLFASQDIEFGNANEQSNNHRSPNDS